MWRRALNAAGLYTQRQVTTAVGMSRRGYDAGKIDRLTSDWITGYTNGDAEFRKGNPRRMIARNRDLVLNNDYARGFLVDVESNIIGAVPFDLRMDVHDVITGGKKRPDELANRLIETPWAEWSKLKNASTSGKMSWRDLKRAALRACVTDGAVLYRHVRGKASRNRFGYSLRLFEIDQLDFDMNRNLPDGGTIRFGVESDSDERIRAFHLFRNHPGEDSPREGNRSIERIPASDMGILQVNDRITQTISASWFAAATVRLRHLGAYEEAEVIAARAGACKGGWFETDPAGGAGYVDPPVGEQLTMDAEPGVWEQLPPGLKAVTHDPTHPNTAFGEFRKAMLRGIATGLGVSYTTLGNDLESVNYSSARVGLLDEREVWKQIQLWFCEHFLDVIFEEWLAMAITSGVINLPMAKFEKFNQPKFKVRRWAWVDPLKDMEALEKGIALRVNSRRQGVDEMGGDIEDVMAANKADETLADSIGLSLTPPDPTPSASNAVSTSTSFNTTTGKTATKKPPANDDS